MIAHRNQSTGKTQSIKEHSTNVSTLTNKYCTKIGLKKTGEVTGLLHDLGKFNNRFYNYIELNDLKLRGKIKHAIFGAQYTFRSYSNNKDIYYKFLRELISLTIWSHHGVKDCINLDGIDNFGNAMKDNSEIQYYDESVNNYINNIITKADLDDKFEQAVEEIRVLIDKINHTRTNREMPFYFHLIERYLLSSVIDADWFDTACFMEGKETIDDNDYNILSVWDDFLIKLENKLHSLSNDGKINQLRKEISDCCKCFACQESGIYQLTVPTGGGKTLASFRYALEHAKKYKKERILYIAPFKTILEQNASTLKDIFKHSDLILVHHSDVIYEEDEGEYKILAERYNSPIILTTLVQFLNTLFSDRSGSIRRMHNLANSVIIIDEVQAIPVKCIHLFNSAMNFLKEVCNTTIIFCTATQPLLENVEFPIRYSKEKNIIPDLPRLFQQFKRVEIRDETTNAGFDYDTLTSFIVDKINSINSLLTIVNTKKSARQLYQLLEEYNKSLPEEEQYLLYHLSTNMCAKNRTDVLNEITAILIQIKNKTSKRKLICISTQLIEAGVDISFESVVRSLAGLDSIAQAAGRCNRHGELPIAYVYIVKIRDEKLDKLKEMSKAQKVTERILSEYRTNKDIFDNDLLSIKALEVYFYYYYNDEDIKNWMNYNYKYQDTITTIYELLSTNQKAKNTLKDIYGEKVHRNFNQAFDTAGKNFSVIEEGKTLGVIVPYKEEGYQLIADINGKCSMEELHNLIKKAQPYIVELYEQDIRTLLDQGAITALKDGQVFSLKGQFYNDRIGFITEGSKMDVLILSENL